MNLQRNTTLDVVKGLSLLSLPAIHSTLLYGKPEIRSTFYGRTLAVLAEYTGAPVFLFVMGASAALGKPKSLRSLMLRSGKLLALAYTLNFLKFIVPGFFRLLPRKMLADNGFPDNGKGLWQLFKTNDILQLAALSVLVCGGIRRSRRFSTTALIAAIFVILFAPYTWQRRLPGLLNGQPPQTFFPAFPWMAYPLFGMAAGKLLARNTVRHYTILVAVGGFGLSLSDWLSRQEDKTRQKNFYRLGPSGTLYHAGFVALLTGACGLLHNRVLPRHFEKWLFPLSKKVTANYMIQWVVVCWLLPLFGYGRLDTRKTLWASLINTVLSFKITKWVTMQKGRRVSDNQTILNRKKHENTDL